MLISANYSDTDNVTKVAADLMDSIHNVRGRALRTARDMANNIANHYCKRSRCQRCSVCCLWYGW
jgi:hypothetical protein